MISETTYFFSLNYRLRHLFEMKASNVWSRRKEIFNCIYVWSLTIVSMVLFIWYFLYGIFLIYSFSYDFWSHWFWFLYSLVVILLIVNNSNIFRSVILPHTRITCLLLVSTAGRVLALLRSCASALSNLWGTNQKRFESANAGKHKRKKNAK